MVNLTACRLPPYQHQVEGIEHIVNHPFAGLFDEMGAGKTKQTIDAAQALFEIGVIDRVLIIAPASVRSVWYDPELGELEKHCWHTINHSITDFHAKSRNWTFGSTTGPQLKWLVTNYEFIRSKARLQQLKPFCTPKTLMVLDESTAIKSHTAQQTKACLELRRACGRVLLLNGTPIANNPGDLYSQGEMMSPKVLECKTWIHFRSRYAIMGTIRGVPNPVIIGWTNLEDLQKRFAPYVLRRLKKDCLDLPEKLPSVTLSVPLSPETWAVYKEMRDEMVAWLKDSSVATASVAAVKAMRLAQITSGFVGGVEALDDQDEEEERPAHIRRLSALEMLSPETTLTPASVNPIRLLGTEKLDYLVEWWKERVAIDPGFKLIVFCRFKNGELFRYMDRFRKEKVIVHGIFGGQRKEERLEALRSLDPRTAPREPVILFGTFGTGAKGLTLTASHTTFYVSRDYSLEKWLQSGDRTHRPGQVEATSYFDLVATGPQGQRTIDHVVVKSSVQKESLATYTTDAWIKALAD
jgi:hypothetical protein